MLSTQFIIKSKINGFLLAEFWLQSETPLSIQECQDAVKSLKWELGEIKWDCPKCVELDESHPGTMTLIDAFIPLSSKVRQLDNGEKQWDATGWHEYTSLDGCVTALSARAIALDWARFDGFEESYARDNIKVNVRYVNKIEYATSDDVPF
jgi:hypothetical protein